MLLNNLLLWIVFFIYLVPISLTGIIILIKVSPIKRIELLIPTGSIIGITLFVFLLNSLSFFIKGGWGVISAYIFLVSIGFLALKFLSKSNSVEYLYGKGLLLYLSSILGWLILLIWKGNHALIGSDTNLYYGVAHTFIRGNFPPMTPWQPGIPLNYHLGAFELLGAFHLFTQLSFEFLHIIFSIIFILFCSQIIIWIWKRHESISSFLWGNLAAAIVFISYGFFNITIPTFPFKLPPFSSLHDFFLWIRELPTVNQSIEVYGAPINLDSMIYFIFHAFGFALMLSILVIIVHFEKKFNPPVWFILALGISTLASINESVFIASGSVLLFFSILPTLKNKTFLKDLKWIAIFISLTIFMIIFQGGFITEFVTSSNELEKSILLFPKKEEIKADFKSYHYYQEVSKKLALSDKQLPFVWFHIGVDILITILVIFLCFVRFEPRQKNIILILFLSGIFSLLAYNFIVPKFIVANGNRFLAFSFIFLSLAVIFSFYNLLYYQTKRIFKYFLLFTTFTLVLLPTVLPPLTLLTKNRFGESKLVPNKEKTTEAIDWINNNLPYDVRMMTLDIRSPHPSGVARTLVQSGVFTPIFPENFRAYTIEASPEYIDIAYFLNPKALKSLNINTLLIDSHFFSTLPQLRMDQLNNEKFFTIIFQKIYADNTWEKVLKIKEDYFKEGKELEGTLRELTEKISSGKIYIDNEENFDPSFIRRPIIFSLRGKDLYFLPQSGVYLNVEVDIPFNSPQGNKDYKYLVLSKKTDPTTICMCESKLIWKGLNGEVYLWERVE